MLVDFAGATIRAINVDAIPCEITRSIARTAEAVADGSGEAGVLVDFEGATITAINVGAIPGETSWIRARTAKAVAYGR